MVVVGWFAFGICCLDFWLGGFGFGLFGICCCECWVIDVGLVVRIAEFLVLSCGF